MTESVCPVCGRPDGAGHEPRCFEPEPHQVASVRPHQVASVRPRLVMVLNIFKWGLWAGRGPKGEHPLFIFLRLGPFEVRFMRRRS